METNKLISWIISAWIFILNLASASEVSLGTEYKFTHFQIDRIESIKWPVSSPEMSLLDSCLSSHLKSVIYSPQLQNLEKFLLEIPKLPCYSNRCFGKCSALV